MLKLKTPLHYSRGVQPICLPDQDFDLRVNFETSHTEETGPVCTISGWGDTKSDVSNVLQQAALPVLSPKSLLSARILSF